MDLFLGNLPKDPAGAGGKNLGFGKQVLIREIRGPHSFCAEKSKPGFVVCCGKGWENPRLESPQQFGNRGSVRWSIWGLFFSSLPRFWKA